MNFVIEVNKVDMISELNFHLDRIPQQNLKFEIKGANVRIKGLNIKQLKVVGQRIDVSVSIEILLNKSTFLTELNADGEIMIDGYIVYSINPEWQLSAEFQYSNHRWLENPDVNIGLIQFSAKSIIDTIIEKQRSKLESAINQQLKGVSDLSEYMKTVLPHVNQSFQLHTTSFQIVPQIEKIIIESIENKVDMMSIRCAFVMDSKLKLNQNNEPEAGLPELLFLPKAI